MGKYVKKHVCGEGIMDLVKSFFKLTPKPKVIPNPPKKVRFDLPNSLAVNKKSGDEIKKLLTRESTTSTKPSRKMSQQEISNRVPQITSGGKIT